MNDLKSTSALVQALMERDPRCRNSDGFLYLRVLFEYAAKMDICLDSITIPDFLMHYHGTEFPVFETVRRARQKVQQHYPELAASDTVKGFRTENEAAYRAFAGGEL